MDPLTSDDYQREFLVCVQHDQKREFGTESSQLRQGQPVARTSALRRLDPFIDEKRTLSGRLCNSSLPFNERHPAIIHGGTHLASLVIRWAHEQTAHGTFRSTYCRVIQWVWLIRGTVWIKRYLNKCVVCNLIHAKPRNQIMASLPTARVTPGLPFVTTGVDCAGPFQVLRSKGRGMRSFKG